MRFTTANSREMAARSVAARKAAAAERLERLAQTSLSPATDSPSATPATGANPGIDVACVRARVVELIELMGKAKGDDRKWDNLSRAADRMFKMLCTLTDTPGPGNWKPEERRRRGGLGSLLSLTIPVDPVNNESVPPTPLA
jgi:hypothetical protein